MPNIPINMDEVPDEYLSLPAGIYPLEIFEVPTLEPTRDGKGEKVVVRMRVNDETNPEHGRQITDHISLKSTTRLKRLCLSAGVNVGVDGFDTEALMGKTVSARVKTRTYQDEDDETQTTSGIKDYQIPEGVSA